MNSYANSYAYEFVLVLCEVRLFANYKYKCLIMYLPYNLGNIVKYRILSHFKLWLAMWRLVICCFNHSFNFCLFYRNIPVGCNEIKAQLINQMNVWNDDNNCGKISETCPQLPCGQNCLYTVRKI